MLVVPATMELLGDRNWWIPRWFDRLLPRLDIEGRSQLL
jgi:RND superfamily putative drug exporter